MQRTLELSRTQLGRTQRHEQIGLDEGVGGAVGVACEEHQDPTFVYVFKKRRYRSSELLLGANQYGPSVDM